MINSNPTDNNGLQITEGATVYLNDPDNYRNNGHFIVSGVEDHYNKADVVILLAYKDGSKPNYDKALPSELKVIAH